MGMITDAVMKQLGTIGEPKTITQTTTASQEPTNYGNLALLAMMMLESYMTKGNTGDLSTEMALPQNFNQPLGGIQPLGTPSAPAANPIGSNLADIGGMNPMDIMNMLLRFSGGPVR